MKAIVPILLLVFGGALLMFGGSGGVTPITLRSPLAVACSTYQGLLEQVSETAISKFESGELTTDLAARDWLEAARKFAQREAWKPIAQRDQERLGGGKWTAAEHAATLREMIGE